MSRLRKTEASTFKWITASLLSLLFVPVAFGQKDKEEEVDFAVKWAGAGELDMFVFSDVAGAYAGMHPSEDGHYLAHDLVELQTYKDLGLSYQYIQEDYLRKQLGLPMKEGIIITAAAKDGEGHKNGLQSGDIVLRVDDDPVDTQYDFVIALSKERGAERNLKLRRNGKDEVYKVRLTKTDVIAEKHWIIGVYVDEVTELTKSQLAIEGGVAITGLVDDGPAHSAGMVEHDIISHINGQLVNSLEDLKKVVAEGNGAAMNLSVVRRGKKINVTVQPIDSPRTAVAGSGTHRYVDLAWGQLAPSKGMPMKAIVTGEWTKENPTMRYYLAQLDEPSEQATSVQLLDVALKGEAAEPGAENVAARLDRLEASIKRIEAALQKQTESASDK